MENWTLHERFGLTILGLLLFRFVWGFYGSETAQFKNFLKGPTSVIQNIRAILSRNAASDRGHSALGGWATLALLLVPTYLILTGLFSTDGTLFDGPLAHFVTFDQSDELADLHHIGEKFLFLVLFLHLAAIVVYYVWLRKNLVMPMVTGGVLQKDKNLPLTKTHRNIGLILLIGLVLGAQTLTLLRPALF